MTRKTKHEQALAELRGETLDEWRTRNAKEDAEIRRDARHYKRDYEWWYGIQNADEDERNECDLD